MRQFTFLSEFTFFLFSLFIFSFSFAQITPPLQPASGPGGTEYIHQSLTKKKYGSGGTAFWIYEPANPKPDSANLIIFNHGWGALNPACYGKWISHLVRKGNIVIFPKWQNDLYTLPQDYTPNAKASILTAVDTLQNGAHVSPRLYNTVYIGYSFGGVISSNLAVQAGSMGIPAPKALLVCNGGNGNTGGAELPSYSDLPDLKLLIIAGDNDIVVADTFGRMLFDSTILVNPLHKNHITQYSDGHGNPGIESTHNEPLSWDSAFYSWDFFDNNWVVNASYAVSKTDAVDFFCYWKFADAITDCAFYGSNCDYAFCNTPEQRFMGSWSDSLAITELLVEMKVPCNTLSEEINEPKNKLQIYPNPNDGNFEIELPFSFKNLNFTIGFFNVLGKKIFQQRIISDKEKLNLAISEEIPKGIYLVKVEAEDTIFYEKIVIQ